MNKKNIIKLTESDLKKVISESVKKVLEEGYNYDPHYEELIKREMHNLWDLSEKVPMVYRSRIYSMGNSLQAILQKIQRNYEFDNWNN